MEWSCHLCSGCFRDQTVRDSVLQSVMATVKPDADCDVAVETAAGDSVVFTRPGARKLIIVETCLISNGEWKIV